MSADLACVSSMMRWLLPYWKWQKWREAGKPYSERALATLPCFCLKLTGLAKPRQCRYRGEGTVRHLWPDFILRKPAWCGYCPHMTAGPIEAGSVTWRNWPNDTSLRKADVSDSSDEAFSSSIYPLDRNIRQLLDISNQHIKSRSFRLISTYTPMGDKDGSDSTDPQRTQTAWGVAGDTELAPQLNQRSSFSAPSSKHGFFLFYTWVSPTWLIGNSLKIILASHKLHELRKAPWVRTEFNWVELSWIKIMERIRTAATDCRGGGESE